MKTPHRITLTGIDERTPFEQIPRGVELGFLYTTLPFNNPRYPSRSVLYRMLQRASSKHSLSLHVCGTSAKNSLREYMVADLTHQVQRIQINGRLQPGEIEYFCELYPDHEIITQFYGNNQQTFTTLAENHTILVDSSGGKGIKPERWERPDTNKTVGFAGGIGPDNIVEVLRDISAIATGDWWVDMESSLRDENDWFDVLKAKEVIAKAADLMGSS